MQSGFTSTPTTIGPGYLGQPSPWGQTPAGQLSSQGAQQGIANTQAAAAMYPATLQQQRFNTLFPFVKGAFGTVEGQIGAQLGNSPGSPGSAGGPPAINAGPVWNPAQIQGQVNSQVAQNNANTASQIKNANSTYGARGIGSGQSPLLAELGAQYQGQGLQANNAAQQGIQWNAAQGNAQQQLAGQQAQQAQYQSGQQNILQARQIAAQQQSALLSALAGMV